MHDMEHDPCSSVSTGFPDFSHQQYQQFLLCCSRLIHFDAGDYHGRQPQEASARSRLSPRPADQVPWATERWTVDL